MGYVTRTGSTVLNTIRKRTRSTAICPASLEFPWPNSWNQVARWSGRLIATIGETFVSPYLFLVSSRAADRLRNPRQLQVQGQPERKSTATATAKTKTIRQDRNIKIQPVRVDVKKVSPSIRNKEGRGLGKFSVLSLFQHLNRLRLTCTKILA